jgi:hypothetical protein
MISDLVYVEGKLHYRDFTDKQGVQRTRTEILQSMFDCTFLFKVWFWEEKCINIWLSWHEKAQSRFCRPPSTALSLRICRRGSGPQSLWCILFFFFRNPSPISSTFGEHVFLVQRTGFFVTSIQDLNCTQIILADFWFSTRIMTILLTQKIRPFPLKMGGAVYINNTIWDNS